MRDVRATRAALDAEWQIARAAARVTLGGPIRDP